MNKAIGFILGAALFLGSGLVYYYPEIFNLGTLGSQKTVVRICSNTYWWAMIYYKHEGEIRSVWPRGMGNHSYEIEGKIESLALHIDIQFYKPMPPNPYIKIELRMGHKTIFSETSQKAPIRWRSDIKRIN